MDGTTNPPVVVESFTFVLANCKRLGPSLVMIEAVFTGHPGCAYELRCNGSRSGGVAGPGGTLTFQVGAVAGPNGTNQLSVQFVRVKLGDPDYVVDTKTITL